MFRKELNCRDCVENTLCYTLGYHIPTNMTVTLAQDKVMQYSDDKASIREQSKLHIRAQPPAWPGLVCGAELGGAGRGRQRLSWGRSQAAPASLTLGDHIQTSAEITHWPQRDTEGLRNTDRIQRSPGCHSARSATRRVARTPRRSTAGRSRTRSSSLTLDVDLAGIKHINPIRHTCIDIIGVTANN